MLRAFQTALMSQNSSYRSVNRDPRYDPLFEPLKIGPVETKNRFYQVPHCNGGGYRDPSAVAEMRKVKAQGGWGVVFTEQVELHHTSEITPYIELRIWDDDDIPMLSKMADSIHEYDALAGIELTYSGVNGPNLYTREVPMSASAMPVKTFFKDPVHARQMDKKDIRDLRRWHRNGCIRARDAGYDLICLYGAHGFGVIQHFLSTSTNQRTDEYGGSLENRARLMAELISECKDAVGDTVAITVRLSLDEMVNGLGCSNSEVRDVIAMHAELPDLWDLAHGAWEDCSGPSRFKEEDAQHNLVQGIKELTSKPVVGVGRFTSPDLMVKQIRSGHLDLIGCARPSIAEPFLPNKIDSGRVEDIRECIGCNICITGDMTMSISRCTQNPTFMEEWRRGWHPEEFAPSKPDETVLVVGAGPAGLEAARVLGERGFDVVLAEASDELGGRVARERHLPGLSAWGRVADYRTYQLSQMSNVEVYQGSSLDAAQVLEFGATHVAIATGATWRRDGVARHHVKPMPITGNSGIYTPDDLMAGTIPKGKVVIYDDDHYYMGGVLAELLTENGAEVTLVTPSAFVSEWTNNTLEQATIHQKLASMGVKLILNRSVESVQDHEITTACIYTGDQENLSADNVVMVTSQIPDDDLWQALNSRSGSWKDHGVHSVKVIGDAISPAPIAWATFAGHRYARELGQPDIGDALPFKREVYQPH